MRSSDGQSLSLGRDRFRALERGIRRRIRVTLGRGARRRTNARFIGITGSSAKSTTSDLLARILEQHGTVASQVLSNTFHDIAWSIWANARDADYFIVESGIEKVGDMDEMARLILPDVAVVTMVGLDHWKEFRTKEAVAAEKAKLVAAVQPGGLAVLNHDDPLVRSMAALTQERIVTFGRSSDADVRVVSAEARYPDRLTVELERDGERVKIPTPFVAEYFWVSVAAAFCAARELGVPTESIVRQCARFEPLPARCEVLRTDDGPVFVLDTFKAPWETLPLAFRIMERSQEVPRKRIVLGGISDYAGSSRTKYKQAYQMARAVCEQVIFVGDHATRSRASDEDRRSGRIVEIESVREVDAYIRRTAVPGELILLKSSKPIHLDRVALSWRHDVQCWEQKCGIKTTCTTCGLYEHPFETHRGEPDRLEEVQPLRGR